MAGQKQNTLGTHWSPQTCWATPEPTEEGEGPTCAAAQELAHKKAGTQCALLTHTKQEKKNKKSVFVTQLSLSTAK